MNSANASLFWYPLSYSQILKKSKYNLLSVDFGLLLERIFPLRLENCFANHLRQKNYRTALYPLNCQCSNTSCHLPRRFSLPWTSPSTCQSNTSLCMRTFQIEERKKQSFKIFLSFKNEIDLNSTLFIRHRRESADLLSLRSFLSPFSLSLSQLENVLFFNRLYIGS